MTVGDRLRSEEELPAPYRFARATVLAGDTPIAVRQLAAGWHQYHQVESQPCSFTEFLRFFGRRFIDANGDITDPRRKTGEMLKYDLLSVGLMPFDSDGWVERQLWYPAASFAHANSDRIPYIADCIDEIHKQDPNDPPLSAAFFWYHRELDDLGWRELAEFIVAHPCPRFCEVDCYATAIIDRDLRGVMLSDDEEGDEPPITMDVRVVQLKQHAVFLDDQNNWITITSSTPDSVVRAYIRHSQQTSQSRDNQTVEATSSTAYPREQ